MLRSMRHGALSGVFIAILALGTFGLVMTDWQGKALDFNSDGRVVSAATPELHREVLALLNA